MHDVDLTDSSLLHAWSERGSQEAFTVLCGRYTGLVYHAALRRSGRHHVAQEVVQLTFAALARKAQSLAQSPAPLAAWLHRVAGHEVINIMRSEAARHRREATHSAMNAADADARDPFDDVLPLIDEALAALPSRDHELILDRFFHQMSFREISARRNESENAVQKRTATAIQRLGSLLRRRGILTTTVGLTAGLGNILSSTAQAAPEAVVLSAAQAVSLAPEASLWLRCLEMLHQWGPVRTAGMAAIVSAATVGTAWVCTTAGRPASAQLAAERPVALPLALPPPAAATPPQSSSIPGSLAPGESTSALLDRLRSWIESPGGYKNNLSAQNVVHQLSLSELPQALSLLREGWQRYGTYHNTVVSALFIRWAELDAKAARAVALADEALDRPAARRDALTGVVEVLCQRGSDGCRQALELSKIGPPEFRETLVATALSSLCRLDADEAWHLANQEADASARHRLRLALMGELSRSEPDKVIPRLRELGPLLGNESKELLARFFAEIAQRDASTALDLAVAFHHEEPEWQVVGVVDVIGTVGSLDPARAIRLLHSLPKEMASSQAEAAKRVASQLGYAKAEAAAVLLDQFPPSVKEVAYDAVEASLVQADPAGVARCFVPERWSGGQRVMRLVSHWASLDLPAADAWAASLPQGKARDAAAVSLAAALINPFHNRNGADWERAKSWAASISSHPLQEMAVDTMIRQARPADAPHLRHWIESTFDPSPSRDSWLAKLPPAPAQP